MKSRTIDSDRRIAVPDSVRRITVLRQKADGTVETETVYRRGSGRGRKKRSRMFKPAERVARRLADAQSRFAQSYLDRHNRSNRKRKDGWMGDYPSNVIRASRKGVKALRLRRLGLF